MRSMNRVASIAVAGACAAGLLSGCAKAPEQELAAAKSALQAAQAVEADKYLADRYANATKALEGAQAEITRQNAAFPLTRNYTQARKILGDATALAAALQSEAASAKEATKMEVEAALTTTQAALTDAHIEVKKAPKSFGKDALKGMAAKLTEADTALVQATAELAAGNYMGARDKIGEAQDKMRKVSDQLSTGGPGGLY